MEEKILNIINELIIQNENLPVSKIFLSALKTIVKDNWNIDKIFFYSKTVLRFANLKDSSICSTIMQLFEKTLRNNKFCTKVHHVSNRSMWFTVYLYEVDGLNNFSNLKLNENIIIENSATLIKENLFKSKITNNKTMKKKKARIFYNSNNWEKADNTDFYAKNNGGYGEIVFDYKIAFGFEEWLFNPILLKLKIGFLECYRQNYFNDKVDIILFTRDRNRGWLSVAELKGVIQIKDNEINHFKSELEKNNWQQQCYNDLEIICGNNETNKKRTKELWGNHWNSKSIICSKKNPRDGFLVNIKYEAIIYHKLNKFDPNKCWRLTKRYNLEDNILWEEEKNSNTPKTTASLNSPPNQNEHSNNSFPNEPHQSYEQNYITLLIRTIMNIPQQAREHLINANRNFGNYIRTEIRNNKKVLIICAGAVHNLYNNGYRGNGNTFRHSVNYIVDFAGLNACVNAMANYPINKPNISFFNHGNNSSQTRFEIIL